MLGQQLSFFIVEVNKKTLTDDTMSKAQSTVIQELELMAVLASVRVAEFGQSLSRCVVH